MSIDTMQLFASAAQPSLSYADSRSSVSTAADLGLATSYRRVLVVEHRDEFFVELQELFESHGCQVSRAASSDAVSAEARIFAPDLILLCGQMPDESGWLIACKLRLGHWLKPIWLYTDETEQHLAAWQEWSGIDHVLFYEGQVELLRRLLPA